MTGAPGPTPAVYAFARAKIVRALCGDDGALAALRALSAGLVEAANRSTGDGWQPLPEALIAALRGAAG